MAPGKLIPELCCSNLERSLSFYVGDLGFEILHHQPDLKFVHLEHEDSQLMLEEMGAEGNWIAGELMHPFGRGVNLKISVTDVSRFYISLQQKGYSFFLPLEEKWYPRPDVMLGNKQFIIQDPDGYLLRFAQNLGTKPR